MPRSSSGRPSTRRATGSGLASEISFGLAALLKVFPALLGVWLLRKRAFRAVGAAVATGGGCLLLGVALFGVGSHQTWFFDTVLLRLNREVFAGGLSPTHPFFTVRRPLSVLFPSLDPTLFTLGAFCLLAPIVAYCYTDLETPLLYGCLLMLVGCVRRVGR